MKENQSVFELARVLDVLGGLLVLVAGVLEVSSLVPGRSLSSLDLLLYGLSMGVVLVALGLVALVGSRYARVVVWNLVLILVGIVAFSLGGRFPWKWGSILIVLGGIVGVVAKLA